MLRPKHEILGVDIARQVEGPPGGVPRGSSYALAGARRRLRSRDAMPTMSKAPKITMPMLTFAPVKATCGSWGWGGYFLARAVPAVAVQNVAARASVVRIRFTKFFSSIERGGAEPSLP